MDEKIIEFRRTLKEKNRLLALTYHAEQRASQRNVENRLIQTDLNQGKIIRIRELDSEVTTERLFDVHVIGTDGQPMRYVVAINNLIRVITLMKVSRLKPRDIP